MIHDSANDGGFVALKWAAEDTEGWRHRERMSKTCCIAEDGKKISNNKLQKWLQSILMSIIQTSARK